MRYSAGYQKFLNDKSKFGKSYQWSWAFFFTSIIWLINNKMYKEFFIFTFSYLSLTNVLMSLNHANLESAIPMISGMYLTLHILMSFFSQNFYYYHLENKFYKAKYDIAKCEKIAKPYPFIVVLILFVIISLFTIICFNISHNSLIYLKNL